MSQTSHLSGHDDGLSADDRAHLHALTGAWGMVADFCFGDLLLLVPAGSESRTGPADAPTTLGSLRFRVHGQVRPTTSQTLYQDDLIGRIVTAEERPMLVDAFVDGVVSDGSNVAITGDIATRVVYIPVTRRLADGSTRRIAVVTKESAIDVGRRPGRLEGVYVEVFSRLARMIAQGTFPFPADIEGADESETPRVGDGVLALDITKAVTYASPNAISALHRLGIFLNAEGRSFEELTISGGLVDGCFATQRPVQIEIERAYGDPPSAGTPDKAAAPARITVLFRAIPLIDGVRTVGAVVLLRDVSDLRRRDRLLLTKDATIREVHHRVKNNLQTISALLRLQGRRLASEEAKEAIEESVRRIRSIALVHETLSRDVRDAVPFDEIVRPLVRMVEEGLASPDRPVQFHVEGELGDLPPETATPLAVVITELLQNAVEHGYPGGTTPRRPGHVHIRLANDEIGLTIEVRDDGVGLPAGFAVSSSKSLGLTLVRTLVTTELGGAIAFRSDEGAVVQLRIPRVADPRARR